MTVTTLPPSRMIGLTCVAADESPGTRLRVRFLDRRLFAAVSAILVSLTACQGEEVPASAAGMIVHVLDSALTAPSWNPMADSVNTYRIAVATRGRGDTIVDVLAPLPTVVGDSAIVGVQLVRDDGEAGRALFRWSPSRPGLETWPVPTDAWYVYEDIVPSPDGRYFAYVGSDDSGTVAIVRELGTGAEVIRGGAGGGCDCDVDLNHARWFAPDSFEIAVAHTATDRGWLLLAGRASTPRVSVSRLGSEPDWHQRPPSRP
jgi:hypothetical protein